VFFGGLMESLCLVEVRFSEGSKSAWEERVLTKEEDLDERWQGVEVGELDRGEVCSTVELFLLFFAVELGADESRLEGLDATEERDEFSEDASE
jgi:hypothetical protein